MGTEDGTARSARADERRRRLEGLRRRLAVLRERMAAVQAQARTYVAAEQARPLTAAERTAVARIRLESRALLYELAGLRTEFERLRDR
jgi:hypothetical protein